MKRTLTDQVYELIRKDILDGALPPGSRLRVEPLKLRYSTGASPIREALTRLGGDGLVQSRSRRGFTVVDVSLVELADIIETRVLIETQSLRSSIECAKSSRRGSEWERRVVGSFHTLSKLDARLEWERPAVDWEKHHYDFHEALVAACPYKRLKRFRRLLFNESERYRRLSLSSSLGERDVENEHRELMEAAITYDAEKACLLLADHIRRTASLLSAAIQLHHGNWSSTSPPIETQTKP